MKIDEAVKILRAHNEWRRAQAHLPEDVMPAMGDPRMIGVAIDTVCDELSKHDDWSRALGLADEAGACVEAYRMAWSRTTRLADEAAESVICTEGHSPAAYHWVLTHEQIAADPHLEDCIAHLEWRGIAKVAREDGHVTVVFEEQR